MLHSLVRVGLFRAALRSGLVAESNKTARFARTLRIPHADKESLFSQNRIKFIHLPTVFLHNLKPITLFKFISLESQNFIHHVHHL